MNLFLGNEESEVPRRARLTLVAIPPKQSLGRVVGKMISIKPVNNATV